MERYQEAMVALSESVMKKCVKRPLASKSPCRLIRLAMKARYIGNHASQIISYCGSLSESHGRSDRIRHENSPDASPSGEITMTSYRLAIKPRYLASHASRITSYYGTLSLSHGRTFRIRQKNA